MCSTMPGFYVGSRTLVLMLTRKPVYYMRYLQPLHLSNQEAQGKRLGFLQDPKELHPRRLLLEGAWSVSCGLSCCLSLRKAKHELKRVTEVCAGTCGELGRVGTRWMG